MLRFAAMSVFLTALLVSSPAAAQYGGGGGMGGGSKGRVILAFSTMYGVNGPFVGAANPLRGVNGDALPWVVSKSAKGSLTSTGKLNIKVKGLVFPDDPSVPPELRGINDDEEFRALVSCITVDGDEVTEENVMTEGFPADTKGNSKIKAQVALPDPCLAPIVMILGGDEDLWFAATGF